MTEDRAPMCRHGRKVCPPCSTPGTGIGKRTAFDEHVENGRILANARPRGTHTLGAEFRTLEPAA